jgi:UDP-glucuronate 4-epimerase
MVILITGSAGFIGHHLAKKLLDKKNFIIGIDSLNNYYSIKLKKIRNKILSNYSKKNNFRYKFYKFDLNNKKKLSYVFKKYKIDIVIHLAAQAGVRYSIENPSVYIRSNLNGFFNILDLCRINNIKHFVYASTSSVYGNSKKYPINENMESSRPLSLYSATKKSNEVISYAYSNIYKIPCTGLRFFTVYGPLGRPDMSLFSFTKNIINKKEINIFNKGNHYRDFTYIDDCVAAIVKIINKPSKQAIPNQIFNVGKGHSVKLLYFIKLIETYLNLKARKIFFGLQKGDVQKTHSDIRKIKNSINFKPKTGIELGVKKFTNWYVNFLK